MLLDWELYRCSVSSKFWIKYQYANSNIFTNKRHETTIAFDSTTVCISVCFFVVGSLFWWRHIKSQYIIADANNTEFSQPCYESGTKLCLLFCTSNIYEKCCFLMFIKGNCISLSNSDFHVLVLFIGPIFAAYTSSYLGSIHPFQKAKVKFKERRISVHLFLNVNTWAPLFIWEVSELIYTIIVLEVSTRRVYER